ncbi:hypothetical protein QQ020_18990 [Fulvivirgaceae bacterium BMA12]|uniref:DUF1835 domain-containing protein n=1 Tax=Agaribacillus aureus TaxID=3051825 RepID=A0ABT8LAA9_9BACT|nr:hypothetical protein [Fulvivirgaceae bacterium BMA12]
MKTLHILNGDATKSLFTQSGLTGDICVWREALATGPVLQVVGSPEFWKLRAQYIMDSFEGYFQKGPDLEEYQAMAVKLAMVEKAAHYDELILWFEYDLFCQINLIALLSWLKHLEPKNTKISLVCIDQFPGHPNFRGLGELKPQDFPSLIGQKIQLTTKDLEFAHEAWLAFADPDPRAIQNLLNRSFPPAFPFLADALKAHIKRFPRARNGLNHLQVKQLELIRKGSSTKKKIVREMLQNDFHYGFGDLQYFEMLHQLAKLYDTQGDQLLLNSTGESVLSGTMHFFDIEKSDFPLGGANGRKYCLDQADETLTVSNY